MRSNEFLVESIIVEGSFSMPFVILSISFAIIGAYTAFMMHDRVNENSFFPKLLWFFMASFALGFGIWSMHYMGMFAFELPFKVVFDPLLTFISLLPILFAAYGAFYLSYKKPHSLKVGIIASMILAVGVVSMHLIGMTSMESISDRHYHTVVMGLALLIAFFSYFMFYTARPYLKNHFIKIIFAILMGSCLSLTHYTAMIGMKIHVPANSVLLEETVPMEMRNLAALILTAVFLFILIFLLLSSFADKYVQIRAENYDILTKLPNLRLFEKSLEENLYGKIAVLNLFDLHKKLEGTTYLVREQIIQHISSILTPYGTTTSEVYRTDYYQFVLLSSAHDKMFIESLKEIRDKISKPYVLADGEILKVNFQFIYMEVHNQQNMEQLYGSIVTNSIKVPFNNEIVNFDRIMTQKTLEEEIIERIPLAIQNDELFVVYQPKFHSTRNTFNDVEALIRWNHPERGFISPGLFIPILEKNPLIFDVTDWIINKVCQQLNKWNSQGIQIEVVSINIPGMYVTCDRLKHHLVEAVMKNDIRPNQIELEITETSYVGNIEEAMEAVLQFRKLGFLVAIDDFGTGVSSLSYLKRLAVTTLKIDKSFVDGIPVSEKDSEIIKGIISLANSLRLNVVIEGVETFEQMNYLKEHFEDALIQGYFYSKPLEVSDLEEFYFKTHQDKSKMITVDI